MDSKIVLRKNGDVLGHKLRRIQSQEIFRIKHKEKFENLTAREIQIASLVVNGLNNPQIAKQLSISRRTVEQHRKNINRKLEVKSICTLFRYALAFDLI